jgi:hypothetical protein
LFVRNLFDEPFTYFSSTSDIIFRIIGHLQFTFT